MLKYLLPLLALSCTIFGLANDSNGPPSRDDKLDYTSSYAINQLQRAQQILATLVYDPQNYQLILSSKPYFGAEAIPAQVFANKPSLIIYQGSLSPNVTNEELAFVIAHELGHIHHQHVEKFDQRMESIMNGSPLGISGTTFNIFTQKCEERQADLFGYDLYQKAGYDMSFFPQAYYYISTHYGHDRHMPADLPLLTSLSMKDSHFSMAERFELLASKTGYTCIHQNYHERVCICA